MLHAPSKNTCPSLAPSFRANRTEGYRSVQSESVRTDCHGQPACLLPDLATLARPGLADVWQHQQWRKPQLDTLLRFRCTAIYPAVKLSLTNEPYLADRGRRKHVLAMLTAGGTGIHIQVSFDPSLTSACSTGTGWPILWRHSINSYFARTHTFCCGAVNRPGSTRAPRLTK